MLAYLIWDPDRNLVVIPYLNHPVTWYGFLFATGILIAYFLVRKMFRIYLAASSEFPEKCELQAIHLTDRMTMILVIGTLLGARLGHVFFYDWHYYSAHPVDIFKIWEGGLASHGGVIGAFVALWVFVAAARKEVPSLRFRTVLDLIVGPTALAGSLIRVGNFINQEITGLPTTLPWGVIFRHPIDGYAGIPLHPVQLYEALFYFLVFLFLFWLWNWKKESVGKGLLSGWFFLLVFGFRFFIEGVKMPQNAVFDAGQGLKMGQWLSLPFICLGILFLLSYWVSVRKEE